MSFEELEKIMLDSLNKKSKEFVFLPTYLQSRLSAGLPFNSPLHAYIRHFAQAINTRMLNESHKERKNDAAKTKVL